MNRRITASEIEQRGEISPAVRAKLWRFRKVQDKLLGAMMGRALATLKKQKLLP